MTDQSVLHELGQRLTSRRLQRRHTQAELAHQAGVSLRTVKRIEAGESAQMSSVIRVLRALAVLENLEALVLEATATPMQRLKLSEKEPRRVRHKPPSRAAPRPWKWGTEQ